MSTKNKVALITGITGQDGSYLAEFLLNKNYEFSKWKNKNLIIELEKGTSILNISYKDQDKTIIFPVLEKMSLTYQQYSQKRKIRKTYWIE